MTHAFQAIRVCAAGRPPMPVVDRRLVEAGRTAHTAAGEQRRGKGHNWITAAQVARIKELRAQGIPQREVARMLGVNRSAVCRWGADVPPPEGGWRSGGNPVRLPRKKILQMSRAGFTQAEIAEDVGCSPRGVGYTLRPRTDRARKHRDEKVDAVTFVVARVTGKGLKALRGRNRQPDLSKARAIVFWACRAMTDRSMPAIARAVGGYDHTSVLHACRRVDAVIKHLDIPVSDDVAVMARALWCRDWPSQTVLGLAKAA